MIDAEAIQVLQGLGSAFTYTGNLRALFKTEPEKGARLITTATMDQIKGGGLGKSAERKLRTGDAQTAFHMNTRGQEPKMYSPEEYAKYGLEKGPLGLPVPQGWRAPRRLEFGQEQQQSSAPDGNISPVIAT